MVEYYNDKYILKKIVNYKFTYHDLNPKQFQMLQHGTGMYCPFHESTHTGTKHARLYYNEDYNLWYIHCYVCGRNYFSYDYVERIMVQQKQLYPNVKAFILSKMNKEEFISLYNLFKEKQQDLIDNQFKRKCEWIDNTFTETGNAIDYIETLYTA